MELEQVLASKIYVKEGSAIQFRSPRQYLQPFVDNINTRMSNGSSVITPFKVSVSGTVVNKEEDQTRNEAFARVLLEARLPASYDVRNHYCTIGILYVLDIQKPFVKVYMGRKASACLNLCIFGAEEVYQQELTGNAESVYEKAIEFVTLARETQVEFERKVGILQDAILDQHQIDEVLGYLLRKANINKVGTSAIIYGMKELYNPKSIYSVEEGVGTNAWNVFGSMSQYITDKTDIMDKANKTLQLAELFQERFIPN